MAEPKPSVPVRHHLVSKGYQKNFADERQRVSVVEARTGKLVEPLRPTKRNWAEDHWNSFEEGGTQNPHLENEFARIEAKVMRSIREVSATNVTPREKAAIVNLFAIHLVRSKSFVEFRSRSTTQRCPSRLTASLRTPTRSACSMRMSGDPPHPES
jgi:Protein of unknown function (DUF4238)